MISQNADARWQPGNFEKNTQAVRRLAGVAAAKGITVAQLALAWLLTRGERIVPIPGTRSPRRVEENRRAAGITLTEAGLAAIHDILPAGHARLDLTPGATALLPGHLMVSRSPG